MGKVFRDRLTFGHSGPINLDIALYWCGVEDFKHIQAWRVWGLIGDRVVAAHEQMIDMVARNIYAEGDEKGGLAALVGKEVRHDFYEEVSGRIVQKTGL